MILNCFLLCVGFGNCLIIHNYYQDKSNQLKKIANLTKQLNIYSSIAYCTPLLYCFPHTFQHHCRRCGHIFCAACSEKTAALAGNTKPVRVCDTCYVELTLAQFIIVKYIVNDLFKLINFFYINSSKKGILTVTEYVYGKNKNLY